MARYIVHVVVDMWVTWLCTGGVLLGGAEAGSTGRQAGARACKPINFTAKAAGHLRGSRKAATADSDQIASGWPAFVSTVEHFLL